MEKAGFGVPTIAKKNSIYIHNEPDLTILSPYIGKKDNWSDDKSYIPPKIEFFTFG